MIDRIRELIDELRENWRDHYWWLRHPYLQAALLAIVSGVLGVMFAYLEERARLLARGGLA